MLVWAGIFSREEYILLHCIKLYVYKIGFHLNFKNLLCKVVTAAINELDWDPLVKY